VKQVLQNLQNGETIVADVPVPALKAGAALIQTAASLVSVGTERMLVSFAEKSLAGKARARPDLVRQMVDKARREGVITTLEAAFTRLDQPMVLGYSSAGTILAVGEGMSRFSVGERVACAGGNYAVHAEYALVPQNLMARIPDGVDFESAAFTTLASIALHGFRLSGCQVGERVAVIGLGLVGLLTCGIAAAAGCHVIGIDLDAQRVALAHLMGAETSVLRPEAEEACQYFSRGRGADSVLICADAASSDPVNLAGNIARERARVVAVGAVDLSLPRKVYYEKELFFVNSRSYGPGRYDPTYEEGGRDYPIGYVRWTEGRNLEAVLDMLATRRLNVAPLITHRFPIEQAPEAYQLLSGKRKEPFLGILLTYPQEGVTPPQVLAPRHIHPPLPSPAFQPVAVVKLGVLGAGNFASLVMLPAMRGVSQLEMAGICSASGVSAQHAARKYGFRFSAATEDEVIHSPEVNTVAVLTRHHLHTRQVVAALLAGKHVFCEKPLALTVEDLSKVQEALQASPGCLLTVGFNRRFSALAQEMRRFLHSRQEPLAVHYRVNAGYLPLQHWLHDVGQGGGRILGEGCHFVDFLIFLAGDVPLSVRAHNLPDGGKYNQDNVLLTFTFADGSLGTIAYLANGDKAFSKERVEVFCGGRVAVLDDFRTLETAYKGKRTLHRSWLRQDKGHHTEWLAFVQALTQSGTPPIPYKHIFGGVQATLAAVQALQTHSEVHIENAAPSQT